MPHLTQHLNSDYIRAATRLQGRAAPRRVVAYVESYDDISFWSDVLSMAEDETLRFDVLLPSRHSLGRGKKVALSNRLGPDMIACVDADYDYLLQGTTPLSHEVCHNPWVLHTGVYAIENLQCHASSLQQVCVLSTLNDHELLDLERWMTDYSRIIYPLLVWNVWCYRYGTHGQFSLSDFAQVVELRGFSRHKPQQSLDDLRHRVNRKINWLQHHFPQGRKSYAPLREQLATLGLLPETAYLYMRGHDLYDGCVAPLLSHLCDALRRERERDIQRLAAHNTQKRNELAAYQHACSPFEIIVRKHTAYHRTPQFRWLVARVQQFVERSTPTSSRPEGETSLQQSETSSHQGKVKQPLATQPRRKP